MQQYIQEFDPSDFEAKIEGILKNGGRITALGTAPYKASHELAATKYENVFWALVEVGAENSDAENRSNPQCPGTT
jgi:hypothetical protein